jgi:putative transposase
MRLPGMLTDLPALDEYPWTGHTGLLGNHTQSWHTTDDILRLFSAKRSEAKRQYRAFITEGMSKQEPIDLSGGGLIRSYGGWQSLSRMRVEHAARIGDERILGDTDFVEMVLMEDTLSLAKQTEVMQSGWDLPTLCIAICHHYQLDEKLLSTRGRLNNVSTARQLVAFFAITLLGVRSGEVEKSLCVSQSGLSKLAQKGRIVSQREEITLDTLVNNR